MLDDFDVLVAEFMDDFGGPATLVTVSSGSYDTTTSDNTETTVSTPVQAILLDFLLRANGLSTVANTLIEVGDKRCYIRPINKQFSTSVMPNISPTSDRVIMGGKTYKIVNVKTVDPSASNTVLYELIIRE